MIIGICEQRLLNQVQFILENIQIDLILLVKLLDKLAPVVPGAVVGKIRAYLLISKLQLVELRQATSLNHKWAMSPAMEVPLVRQQEITAQFKLILPIKLLTLSTVA